MAGHDFAHNEAPIQRPPGSSLMPVMAILLVALLCFAAGYWLGQAGQHNAPAPASAGSDLAKAEYANLQARFEQQQKQLEELGRELQKWKTLASRDASSKVGDLQFYKELPRQSVMPAPLKESDTEPSDTGSSASQAAEAVDRGAEREPVSSDASSQMLASIIGREMQRSEKGEFRIQAGSFRSSAEAVPFQKRLDAAGFPSFIDAVDLGVKGRWQRVYVGPYASRGAAEKARRDLREQMNISGLLVRKKG